MIGLDLQGKKTRDEGEVHESLGIYCNLEVGVPDNARSINKKATFNGYVSPPQRSPNLNKNSTLM